MKIVQLVKQLNNTELGKGGTHDTYVLIPNELEINDIFESVNSPVEFIDYDSKEIVTVRHTMGREKRIVGLGNYYRTKGLSAGDELILERRTSHLSDKFIIRVRKFDNCLVFQKAKAGFEILTPERLKIAESWSRHLNGSFSVDFLTSARKRNDSPETTDFYNIVVEGKSILNSYLGKEIGLLTLKDNRIKVSNFYGWKKYEIEMEDQA